jgi:hypothetical protein
MKVSVSASLLPERLDTSPQVNSSGVQTWRSAAEWNIIFEVHGILHLLT